MNRVAGGGGTNSPDGVRGFADWSVLLLAFQNPVHPVGIPYTFRSRLQNQFKIVIVQMNIYAKIQSDDWLNEAMCMERLKSEC
jgi:hypothetical protein